jgi:hypothetical protein
MTDINAIVQHAQDAFWQVVVRHFPYATTGDLSPLTTLHFDEATEVAVREWVRYNATTQHDDVKIGYRFKLFREVDRFPDFKVGAGLTGTVTLADDSGVWARMDEHIPGTQEWDNHIHWEDPYDFAGDTMPLLTVPQGGASA